jgi:membrane protein implicated in regulation of membrane protease activity
MPAWLIWLVVSGALALAEVFTLTLVLIMFAGGAAAAAITAALGGPVALQFIFAVAVSLALLGGVRPVARQHMLSGPAPATGSDALVGMEAVVLSEVDRHDGRVRLNGAEWSARSFDREQVLSAGTVVRVMSISGATAVVWQEPKV